MYPWTTLFCPPRKISLGAHVKSQNTTKVPRSRIKTADPVWQRKKLNFWLSKHCLCWRARLSSPRFGVTPESKQRQLHPAHGTSPINCWQLILKMRYWDADLYRQWRSEVKCMVWGENRKCRHSEIEEMRDEKKGRRVNFPAWVGLHPCPSLRHWI